MQGTDFNSPGFSSTAQTGIFSGGIVSSAATQTDSSIIFRTLKKARTWQKPNLCIKLGATHRGFEIVFVFPGFVCSNFKLLN